MSDSSDNKEMKFTIWNTPPFVSMWAPLLLVLTGLAALALMFPTHKDVNAYTTVAQILGCIILAVTIGTPVFLAFWYKNEISYDGEEIQIKNVFRKKTINLHEIKKLDYDIHVYAIRGGGSWFELMIWRDEIMSDEYDYISLFETADSQSFRDIAKGDHSAINLLMLYDDIIAANPEKKKEKEENKEAEKEDDDSQDII